MKSKKKIIGKYSCTYTVRIIKSSQMVEGYMCAPLV